MLGNNLYDFKRPVAAQCINTIAETNFTSTESQQNVFEDITIAENSYNLFISTVGDLVRDDSLLGSNTLGQI